MKRHPILVYSPNVLWYDFFLSALVIWAMTEKWELLLEVKKFNRKYNRKCTEIKLIQDSNDNKGNKIRCHLI